MSVPRGASPSLMHALTLTQKGMTLCASTPLQNKKLDAAGWNVDITSDVVRAPPSGESAGVIPRMATSVRFLSLVVTK